MAKMSEASKAKFDNVIKVSERAKVFGFAEFKHPDNLHLTLNTPVPLYVAFKELGVPDNYITRNLNKYPELRKKKDSVVKDIRKEQKKNADKILGKALDLDEGGMKMKDVERANLALNFQKATNEEFNPAKNVNLAVEDLDFSNLANLKRQLAEEVGLNHDEDNE